MLELICFMAGITCLIWGLATSIVWLMVLGVILLIIGGCWIFFLDGDIDFSDW